MTTPGGTGNGSDSHKGAWRDRLPDDSPLKWVEPGCRYCTAVPCLTHDRRPRTLAQNRVIFGPAFGYEPTEADHAEAAFPWA